MRMSFPLGLDPDLLRAFVLIADGGSFTRAANVVGRTQSAVSMQVKRLEQVLGQPVLARRKGGGVQLTPHGEYLLARARDILALNDEVMATFHTPVIAGTVRLGTPDDYALRYLPQILKRFAETHPAVEVEVTCEDSELLVRKLQNGELDLTICTDGNAPPGWPSKTLWRGPLMWITSARHAAHRQETLRLALAHPHCSWRRAAIRALEEAGRPYRIAYTSVTQVGSHAAVMAGLAVTVSTLSWLPEGLRPLKPEEGLPPLPDFGIAMLRAEHPTQPVTEALAAHIEDSFRVEAGVERLAAA